MCGIAGYWRPSGLDEGAAEQLIAMTDVIARRGPDAEGHWLDAEHGVAMGHRRLAIIDLSPTGQQPMESADGRYVIVFNGEVYNFQDLRARLDTTGTRHTWRGHSDTEVLLAALSVWGLERMLKAINGMFAFALWDRKLGHLTLARDRMGEKPLYYCWAGSGDDRSLLFGSELSALRTHRLFQGDINPEAVALLMRYLHIPEPHSIYRNVAKLMPGTAITFAADGAATTHVYWDTLSEYAKAATTGRFTGDGTAAIDALEAALGAAVARQSIADVPLGTFLSGGVDSSAITALMQAGSSRPVKSFSIGFTEAAYDESPHARAVAEHLGTDHHELIVSPEAAQAVIPNLPSIYSEPFADSSQIPTFLVAQMAREKVTVALSGDAGDELFAGYNRHVHGHLSWPKLSRLPGPLRQLAAQVMTGVSPATWDATLGRFLASKVTTLGDKLHKSAGVLSARDGNALYAALISINQQPDQLLRQAGTSDGFEGRNLAVVAGLPLVDRMMAKDAVHYLPGDILTKVDRAAMAVSLETRVPMLDVDVMRLAWSLPAELKLQNGVNKWPLRQLLYRHVPKALIERPKQGFGVPIDRWLRGPLRDWAESLLSDTCYPLDEYFHRENVIAMWNQHLSGRKNFQHQIWPILMFQGWRSAWHPTNSTFRF